jgi:hypothetical protein
MVCSANKSATALIAVYHLRMHAFYVVVYLLFIKFGLPVALVFTVMFVKNWWRASRESRADGWPAANSSIWSGTVKPMQSGRRSVIQLYECILTYNYFASEYQVGTYKKIFRSEQAADDFIAACKGKDVQVRYDPGNVARSVLREQDLRLVVPMALAPVTSDLQNGDQPSRWAHVRTIFRPFL